MDGEVLVPSQVDFEVVPAFAEVQETLLLVNEGAGVQALEAIEPQASATGPGYAFRIEAQRLPLEIPVQGIFLDVFFSSTAEVDDVIGAFVLRFDSGQASTVNIRAGTGDALSVEPSTIDFGRVVAGRVRDESFTITNLLNRPVVVYGAFDSNDADLEILSGVARFDVDVGSEGIENNILAGANPLPPRGSLQVSIAYTADPATSNLDRATWSVAACPDQELCGIPITIVGEPVPSAVTCAAPQIMDGAIDVGVLNPPATVTATVTCTASDAIRVDSIIPPGLTTGFDIFSELAPPADLNGGDTFNIRVRFDPADLEPGQDAEDDLEVRLRDPGSGADLPPVVIGLLGGHGVPVVSANPTQFDFQSVRVGSTKTLSFELLNDGPVPFEGQLEFAAGSPFDAIDPFVDIPANGAATVELRFSPMGEGAIQEDVRIVSRSERTPDVMASVTIRGQGLDLPVCDLRVSDSSIDLGQLIRGQESRGYIAFENDGTDGECIINAVRLLPDSAPEFSLLPPFDAPGFEAILSPGEALVMEVSFTGDADLDTGSTVFTGTIELYNSSAVPLRTFDLLAEQVVVPLIASPNIVDLRNTSSTCGGYDVEIELLNATDNTIALTQAGLSGFDIGNFQLVNDMLPISIPALGSQTIALRFSPPIPTAGLIKTASVDLEFSDGSSLRIPAIAEANDSRIVETFVQQREDVATLFVIPGSFRFATLGADRLLSLVASGFSDFTAPFTTSGQDYQISFITSERTQECFLGFVDLPMVSTSHGGSCGLLSTGGGGQFKADEWRVVDATDTPSPSAAWSAHLSQQLFGNSALVTNTLGAFLPITRGWNAPLFEGSPYIQLVFIDVSDEFLSGYQASPALVAEFIRAARGAPNQNRIGASGLIPAADDDCVGPSVQGTAAPNLNELVRSIGGGQIRSVCDQQPLSALQLLGEDASGLRRIYPATEPAIPSTVRVSVDGVPLARNDGPELNWSFDDATNSLSLFDPVALAAGASVEVSYRRVCDI